MAGCETLGVRDVTLPDQVPAAVKAEPMLVEKAPPAAADQPWPRLGDVPFKPKDFSPKPVYDHYMNEMEFHRAEAQAAQRKAIAEDPTLPADENVPQGALLLPPQMPQAAQP